MLPSPALPTKAGYPLPSPPKGSLLSVPAAQVVGGSPSEPGAVRAAGRFSGKNRPLPGFHNPEKGCVRGGTSSPHPRGPGAAAPGALSSGLSPGESPGPRGSGPRRASPSIASPHQVRVRPPAGVPPRHHMSSVSIQMVTGPSLTELTAMSAPN